MLNEWTYGVLKSMDGRSLWIGIGYLEGARLRKKLRFVVRNWVRVIYTTTNIFFLLRSHPTPFQMTSESSPAHRHNFRGQEPLEIRHFCRRSRVASIRRLTKE